MENVQKLDIVVEAQLIISIRELNKLREGKVIFATLKSIFRYKNPKFLENEKWGRSNHKVAKHLLSYEIDEDNMLLISRGGKEKLIKHLAKFKITPNFIDRTLVLPSISFEQSNIEPREDQEEFITDLLAVDDGSAVAYASFGKTVAGLEIVRIKKQPSLILVHTTFLQEQWIATAIDPKMFNLKIGDIGGVGGVFGGKAKLGKVNICLYHSLCKPKHLEFFKEKIGLVLFDEGQKSPIEGVQSCVNQLRARYRYTFSANLARKDGKEFLTFDTFGPVKHIAKETNSASKILSTINLVPSNFYDIEYEDDKQYSAYITRASKDKDRNILICKRAIRKIREGKLVLIFVERKVQAATLYKMLSKFRGDMLLGKFNLTPKEIKETPSKVLEVIQNHDDEKAYGRILKLADKKKLDYIIGTQKAEVGLSIRTIDHAVVTTPVGNNLERFNQMKGRPERTYSDEQEAYFGHKKAIPSIDVIVDKNDVSRESANKIREHYGKKIVSWIKNNSDRTNLIIRKKEN